MKIYDELADWWPLVSTVEEYAEESAEYAELLQSGGNVRTVLELGSGGGNNASFLKRHFTLTLVDPSPGMRQVSERLNPECRHFAGDMRSVRLGEIFDAVFIHDAVQYMTTEADLRLALDTAAAHLRPGGTLVVAPDSTRETFHSQALLHEGEADGRRLRYVEWPLEPREGSTEFEVHYAFLMQERDGSVRCVHDVHHEGLFTRAAWIRACKDAGLDAHVVSRSLEGTEFDTIVARKR